jgi:hypothetical protein
MAEVGVIVGWKRQVIVNLQLNSKSPIFLLKVMFTPPSGMKPLNYGFM